MVALGTVGSQPCPAGSCTLPAGSLHLRVTNHWLAPCSHLQNNLLEMWALFNFCAPDLLGDAADFRLGCWDAASGGFSRQVLDSSGSMAPLCVLSPRTALS